MCYPRTKPFYANPEFVRADGRKVTAIFFGCGNDWTLEGMEQCDGCDFEGDGTACDECVSLALEVAP